VSATEAMWDILGSTNSSRRDLARIESAVFDVCNDIRRAELSTVRSGSVAVDGWSIGYKAYVGMMFSCITVNFDYW